MRTEQKSRWSLPRRLRDEGWWLVEPPGPRREADILPFVPRSRRMAATIMPRKVRR
jgi:hypothetical protein